MRLLIGILLLFLLSSCTTLKQRRHELISQHNWSDARVANIKAGVVRIGYTPDQVRAAWGTPADINSTYSANYTQTQWVYYKIYSNGARYVYFRNGRVSSMQNW
jgi:outer membrane protein assembly factor BamE (lipoprotein component of BamABCDE complex)